MRAFSTGSVVNKSDMVPRSPPHCAVFHDHHLLMDALRGRLPEIHPGLLLVLHLNYLLLVSLVSPQIVSDGKSKNYLKSNPKCVLMTKEVLQEPCSRAFTALTNCK